MERVPSETFADFVSIVLDKLWADGAEAPGSVYFHVDASLSQIPLGRHILMAQIHSLDNMWLVSGQDGRHEILRLVEHGFFGGAPATFALYDISNTSAWQTVLYLLSRLVEQGAARVYVAVAADSAGLEWSKWLT